MEALRRCRSICLWGISPDVCQRWRRVVGREDGNGVQPNNSRSTSAPIFRCRPLRVSGIPMRCESLAFAAVRPIARRHEKPPEVHDCQRIRTSTSRGAPTSSARLHLSCRDYSVTTTRIRPTRSISVSV